MESLQGLGEKKANLPLVSALDKQQEPKGGWRVDTCWLRLRSSVTADRAASYFNTAARTEAARAGSSGGWRSGPIWFLTGP